MGLLLLGSKERVWWELTKHQDEQGVQRHHPEHMLLEGHTEKHTSISFITLQCSRCVCVC